MDTEALLERYRKEIEELKARLAEREADAPVKNRRLSAREVCLFSLLVLCNDNSTLSKWMNQKQRKTLIVGSNN